MKRIRTIQLAVTLMVLLVPTASSAVNTIIHTVNYGSSGMTVGTDTLGGVTYTTVNYGDLFNGGEPGKPSLPIDYLKFSVPYNATNFSVTATLSNNMTSYIDHLVYPCQLPRMMNDTTPVVINMPDSSVYYTNSYYPSQAAWVVDEGFLAGENHIVTVAVMPIAYKHTKGKIVSRDELRRYGTVRLTLRYDLSDSLAMYPIVRNDTALRNEGYRLTQSMVVNPTNVEAYAPDIVMDTMMVINPNSGDGLNEISDPGSIGDLIDPNPGVLEQVTYPYLIVTTPELKHSLRRLAALKRQKGYSTLIVTMDDVVNDSYASCGDRVRQADGTHHIAFNDDAGKLRQFLRIYYGMHETQYVLLAGKEIPFRSRPFYKTTAPTDLYYSELNADWSTDKIEKGPELYIGRIMPRNDEHVNNYTDKLLRYELNPGHGNRTYLKKALFTEGHDAHTYNEFELLRWYVMYVFSDTCVMREDTSANRRFPSGVDIVNEINNTKYGYLSFHNHAYPSGLLTYGHRTDSTCNDDPPFYFLWAIDSVRTTENGSDYIGDLPSGNGLNNLTNKLFPSVGYSTGCTTMPFDTIPHFENLPFNFGESFTLGKDYGGPAFLGNTREGYFHSSTVLEAQFTSLLSSIAYFKEKKIGILEAFSKVNYNREQIDHIEGNDTITDFNYFSCVHNLLGDPEFEFWTNTPQEFTNIQVTRSDDQISVSVGNTNSTIVACYSNDGKWRKTTTSSNVVFNGMSPNSTIMVYKHNYIPYIAPLLLQNVDLSKSQYVIASDVTAGKAVDIDSNRTKGDVTVKNGVEYEIEASGTVTLQDGFKVEKGATFAVYPSCF